MLINVFYQISEVFMIVSPNLSPPQLLVFPFCIYWCAHCVPHFFEDFFHVSSLFLWVGCLYFSGFVVWNQLCSTTELHPQTFFFLRQVLAKLLGLALNFGSPCLSFLSSWDDRYPCRPDLGSCPLCRSINVKRHRRMCTAWSFKRNLSTYK